MDAERPGERRRARGRLKDFYGVAAPAPGGPPPPPANPRDLQDFDAKSHFESVVASGKTFDVLKTAAELNAEARDLDGDSQMLVYENYNKFIRAIDVIKDMSGKLDGLEPSISNLDSHLVSIRNGSTALHDRVSGNAAEMKKLVSEQQSCKKLKVLFSLPDTLQRCLDGDAYGQAVEAYCCCIPILRQHKGIPALANVLSRVESQMSRIQNALEQRLSSPDLSVAEAARSAQTLVLLGAAGPDLARRYLGGRSVQLKRALDRCFPSPASGVAAEGELLEASHRVSKDFLGPLVEAIQGVHRLRECDDGSGGGIDVPESMLETFVSARFEDLCDHMNKYIRLRRPSADDLLACVHCLGETLQRLEPLMSAVTANLQALLIRRAAASAVQTTFAQATTLLVDDIIALNSICISQYEEKRSGAAVVGLDAVLDEIMRIEQSQVQHATDSLVACQVFLPLAEKDGQARAQFVGEILRALLGFGLSLADLCYANASADITQDPELPSALALPRADKAQRSQITLLPASSAFSLALFRLAKHLEKSGLSKLMILARDSLGAEIAGEDGECTAVLKMLHAATEVSFGRFMVLNGQRLAHFFRNSMQARSWVVSSEPTEPNLVVEMVLKDAQACEIVAGKLLGEKRKHISRGRGQRREDVGAMELEMERLFARKLQVFSPVSCDRMGAIVGILRIACKAFCEYVREQTFNEFGLQQIQVDANFLGDVARDMVEVDEANVLDSLLEEVVASAEQRCNVGARLEKTIVQAICETKKRTFVLA